MSPIFRGVIATLQRTRKRMALWGFHHLYQDWAGAYDAVAAIVSWGRWYDWVGLAVPEIRGPRVLEVGPGTGHLLALLCETAGVRPIGVDSSNKMLRLAQARTRGRVPLVLSAARKLPIASLTFDSVVCTFPAEFIRDGAVLREFHRALRPSGRLIILPTAQLTGHRAFERLAAWALKVIGQAPGNAWEALEQALVPLLERQDFEVELRESRPAGSRVFLIVATKAAERSSAAGFGYSA